LYVETGVRPFGTERASDALVAALGTGPAWLKPTPSEMVCCAKCCVSALPLPVRCALCFSPPAELCAPRCGVAAHRMAEEFRRLGIPGSRNSYGRGHAQPRVDRAATHALGNAARRHSPWQVCPPPLGHLRATEASFSPAPDDPPINSRSLCTHEKQQPKVCRIFSEPIEISKDPPQAPVAKRSRFCSFRSRSCARRFHAPAACSRQQLAC